MGEEEDRISPHCSQFLALGSCGFVGDMKREEWPLCGGYEEGRVATLLSIPCPGLLQVSGGFDEGRVAILLTVPCPRLLQVTDMMREEWPLCFQFPCPGLLC